MDGEQLESIDEIQELRQIAEDQKTEIQRLRNTIDEQLEAKYKNNEIDILQKEYQDKINQLSQRYQEENLSLQDKLKTSEDNNVKLLNLVQSKDDETKSELKPPQIKQIKSTF